MSSSKVTQLKAAFRLPPFSATRELLPPGKRQTLEKGTRPWALLPRTSGREPLLTHGEGQKVPEPPKASSPRKAGRRPEASVSLDFFLQH